MFCSYLEYSYLHTLASHLFFRPIKKTYFLKTNVFIFYFMKTASFVILIIKIPERM